MIKAQLNNVIIHEEETPLLREQEYKVFTDLDESARVKAKREVFGIFWYRFKFAESVADVHQRIQIFVNNLLLRKSLQTLKGPVVLITHEVSIRMLLMILEKRSPEKSNVSIPNGEILEITPTYP